MRRLGRRQRLAVDHLDDAVDARGDAAGKIAGLEFRGDHFVDDAVSGDVGETALKPITDLDAQMMIVLGNHQQRAVVDLLAAVFQVSATRIEYCSMVSGAVVGTINTAIWLPLRASRPFKVCVRAAISSLDRVPVWLTTRAV